MSDRSQSGSREVARSASLEPPRMPAPPPANVLIVSRHDYRTDRRTSIHFLARAMVAQGHVVRFVSVGFSWMSAIRDDPRLPMSDLANQWQKVDGIHAFLWKTPWHAVDLPVVGRYGGWLYDLWARLPCDDLDAAAAAADTIIIDSGIAPVLIGRLRMQAPSARLIYRAADLLETAGVHRRVQQVLERDAAEIDLVVVVAPGMLPHFDRFPAPKLVITHGVDKARLERETLNPYDGPNNIVSVGSMLFDAEAVRTAARALPDHTIHLIGNPPGPFPANVRQYGEMPFADTLRFLQHADVGLAPYRSGPGTEYLADSSLKLLQFGALGLPAVCPHFAVGHRPLRFGYDHEHAASIVPAIRAAARAKRQPVAIPDWADVADRLMEAMRD